MLKTELHGALRDARAANLITLEGLSDFDLIRPLTPSGTNLLGVVKHLGRMEYGYLGETFGRHMDRSVPGVTLSQMMRRVVAEELRHGGHLDLASELVGGTTKSNTPRSQQWWAAYPARLQEVAEAFR